MLCCKVVILCPPRLPVEVWYRADEMNASHPVLVQLQKENGDRLTVREITDPTATWFYVKPYAIYNSRFQQVMPCI